MQLAYRHDLISLLYVILEEAYICHRCLLVILLGVLRWVKLICMQDLPQFFVKYGMIYNLNCVV